ncbi:MAG TPA: hypothetical protein VEB39_00530 [Sphingomicrobium sp.]|nr:hypothetical protein [Sphingomicrobium sp.]
MLSHHANFRHPVIARSSVRASLTLGAILIIATPAHADILLGLDAGALPNVICLNADQVVVGPDSDDCLGAGNAPPYLRIGNSSDYANFDSVTGAATFNGAANFNDNVQMSGLQAFSGTSTFNSTVSFVGPSVTFMTGTTFTQPSTFNALADFNSGLTSNTITNSGAISTNSLTSGSIITTSLLAQDSFVVSNGATVNMGGNIVSGVAAGVADTDAVNVGQLNAASAGITADVTALETTTATHATQIAAIQTVNATQATQITALQAADAELNTRITSLEALALEFEQGLDDVDDRASAGTAAAVALSGAMFLPGKSFNLTGNVGAYRGAVAGALQFGALVSDNAAINAGVAHGFNKGGKTAVRAGFTFGW